MHSRLVLSFICPGPGSTEVSARLMLLLHAGVGGYDAEGTLSTDRIKTYPIACPEFTG